MSSDTRFGWKELEEELTCFHCCSLFQNPVTIPCLHTFCEECIQSNVQSNIQCNIQSSNDGWSFSCFICHTNFSYCQLAKFPVNIHIERLVTITTKYHDIHRLAETGDKLGNKSWSKDASGFITCSQCDQGAPATMWCLTCRESEMCEECYKCHCRLKIFNSHKVITLEEFMWSPSQILNFRPLLERCKEHGGQVAEFYCRTCLQFACKSCNCMSTPVDPNKKHDVDTVGHVYELYKKQLGQLRQSLHHALPKVRAAIEKNVAMEQTLEETIDKEAKWINMRFQEIRELVDEHEEKLLQNLETIKSTTQALLKSQKAGWNQLESQMRSCDKHVSGVLQPCRSFEVISYIDWIKDLGLTFRKHHDFDPAYNVDDLCVSHNTDCVDVFASMLNSLMVHHAFHDPYPPNCTVKMASKCTVPVSIEVKLKDKYKLSVSINCLTLYCILKKIKNFLQSFQVKIKQMVHTLLTTSLKQR